MPILKLGHVLVLCSSRHSTDRFRLKVDAKTDGEIGTSPPKVFGKVLGLSQAELLKYVYLGDSGVYRLQGVKVL